MEYLGLPLYPSQAPRFNITPTSELQVLTGDSVLPMEWGIEFGKFRHPNTRAESVETKPYLQKLLMKQRCIVPVNRFYEWPDAKYKPEYKGIKTRFCIHTPDNVMFLGALYKLSRDGVLQVNIITTASSKKIAEFHRRMPLIIPPEKVKSWFQGGTLAEIFELVTPYDGELVIYPCSGYVDNGRNEGPRCMESIDAPDLLSPIQP